MVSPWHRLQLPLGWNNCPEVVLPNCSVSSHLQGIIASKATRRGSSQQGACHVCILWGWESSPVVGAGWRTPAASLAGVLLRCASIFSFLFSSTPPSLLLHQFQSLCPLSVLLKRQKQTGPHPQELLSLICQS